MSVYPKIKGVDPLDAKQLLVTFSTGEDKIYDCTPLLAEPEFSLLKNEMFFRTVRVDHGGYGVVWNEEVDLSESELWIHGENSTLSRQL